jgi:hypothetical protein
MEMIALSIFLLALSVLWHGRSIDVEINRTEGPSPGRQADAIAKIADLIDRELPSGYRHIDKMRERSPDG